ncbi:hypothetical protein, partial [Paenibacillus gansuensis]
QKTHTRKQEMLANIRKAIKEADAVVYAAATKPDATKLSRFEAELRDLKTQLMLTTSAQSGFAKLNGFIQRLDDPYLANLVREQYADIAMPIVSLAGGADSAKYRLQLSQAYDGLKSKFETDEVREAREILETAKSIEEDPKLYPPGIVQEAATIAFGREQSVFMNNTDAYFERNPGERPADYVDPEKVEAKPKQSDHEQRLEDAVFEKWRQAEAERKKAKEYE